MADSSLQTIFIHETADLSKVRPFAHTRGQPASPDGSAVDAEGYLWNAQWDGARVVRYAPDGRIDRIVEMPVARPTSCAFGGEDFTTLYVTSAWDGLSPGARAAQPLAGGLFAFDAGVKGLALPLFAGRRHITPPQKTRIGSTIDSITVSQWANIRVRLAFNCAMLKGLYSRGRGASHDPNHRRPGQAVGPQSLGNLDVVRGRVNRS